MNTPETDAALTYYCESDEEGINPLVDQDFARKIERERDAAEASRKINADLLNRALLERDEAFKGFIELRDLLDRCSIDECPPDFSETLEALDAKLKPLIKP